MEKKKINSGAGFKYYPVNKVFLLSAMQKCALGCWKQLYSCGEAFKSDSSFVRCGSWNCLGCSDEIKVLDFSLTLQDQLWHNWGPLGPAGACPCWTGFPVSQTVSFPDLTCSMGALFHKTLCIVICKKGNYSWVGLSLFIQILLGHSRIWCCFTAPLPCSQ